MDIRLVALLVCQTHLLTKRAESMMPAVGYAAGVLAMFAMVLEKRMPDDLKEGIKWGIEFAEYHINGVVGESVPMLLRAIDEEYKG